MTSKLLFRLLPVQILISSISAFNSIVSSLFASNFVGVDAMSAIGCYAPLNMLIGAVSFMLLSGSAILCGKHLGKNEPDKVQDLFSLNCALTLFVSVGFVLFLLVVSLFDLGRFLTQDQEVRKLLNQYMLGQAIGVFPLMLSAQLPVFLSLESRAYRTFSASIGYFIANVLLNLLFVRGMHLEALGLALASSLALWIFCIIMAQYFFSAEASLRFSRRLASLENVLAIIRVGIPGAANSGYQTLRGFIVNMLVMTYVGSVGLSAFTAANTLLGIVWAIPAGMLTVSRLMISVSVGEEDRQTLIDTMRNAVFRFFPLMCVVSAAVMALAVPLTHLYYHDPSEPVFIMTVWGFRILPLCMPLAVLRMHFSCYGQTVDRHVMVNILEALDGFVFVSIFTALLIPFMGIKSVYIANVLNGIAVLLYLLGYAILKNRRMPKNMEELMVIPSKFGVPEQDRMDLSLYSMEEVVSVAQKVQSFCLEKGLDSRRAFFAALFLEEMAGNVVLHGFNKDSKNHSVNIRVVHKEGRTILRIKDDCIPFDPAERKEMFDPKDPAKNVGIRLVYGIAEEIRYQFIVGMNILGIWI